MSKAQHTPGPWIGRGADGKFSSKNKWHAEHDTASLSMAAPIMAGKKTVALVVDTTWDEVEFDANARLISAAPELLEVAEGILVDDLLPLLPAEYIAKVQAVIAKAKGGVA